MTNVVKLKEKFTVFNDNRSGGAAFILIHELDDFDKMHSDYLDKPVAMTHRELQEVERVSAKLCDKLSGSFYRRKEKKDKLKAFMDKCAKELSELDD